MCIDCEVCAPQDFGKGTIRAQMSQAARDAVREAQAEGLTLTRSHAASGYRGVYRTGPVDAPFRALLTEMPSRRQVSLGCFTSVEEAALCYARAIRDRDEPAVVPVNEGATMTALLSPLQCQFPDSGSRGASAQAADS